MPSTARLLSATTVKAVHAHKPDDPHTLCGLNVVLVADWEDSGEPPARSADYTGVRFYTGVVRGVCGRCAKDAVKIRLEITESVPLDEVRTG